MNAAVATRAFVYAEELEAIHGRLELLATSTNDDATIGHLDDALGMLALAGLSLNRAAKRAATMAEESDRQKAHLLAELKASLVMVGCEAVGRG